MKNQKILFPSRRFLARAPAGRILLGFAGAMALILTAAQAPAALYRISGSANGIWSRGGTSGTLGDDLFVNLSSPSYISHSAHYEAASTGETDISTYSDGYAAAGYAAAHVRADSFYSRDDKYSLTDDGSNGVQSSGSAWVSFDDLIVTGPAGSPATLTTQLNLHLDGSVVAASTLYTGSNRVNGGASVSVRSDIYYNRSDTPNAKVIDGFFQRSSVGGSASTTGFGQIADFDGDEVVTSDPFLVYVNQPFGLSFQLGATSGAGMHTDNSGIGSGAADFSNTLTFASSVPVFDLPDGYTLNSVSAGIVNNQFIGVPEPSTATGLITGAVLLASRRRRRR